MEQTTLLRIAVYLWLLRAVTYGMDGYAIFHDLMNDPAAYADDMSRETRFRARLIAMTNPTLLSMGVIVMVAVGGILWPILELVNVSKFVYGIVHSTDE